jgi:hypothetical protein
MKILPVEFELKFVENRPNFWKNIHKSSKLDSNNILLMVLLSTGMYLEKYTLQYRLQAWLPLLCSES